MALLYHAVNLSNDSKKQAIIHELLKLGVTEFKGRKVDELDFYEAKHALSIERVKRS